MHKYIKDYNSIGDLSWLITIVASIFMQILVCQWQMFHTVLVSALWTSPLTFFLFYAPKLAISIIVASIVLLFKNRKARLVASVVISVLIDIWILSELVYFRANHVILDAYTIRMIDNMDGFWGSTLLYIEPLDSLLLLITAALTVCLIWLGKKNALEKKVNWKLFLALFCGGLILDSSACLINQTRYNKAQWVALEKDLAARGDEVFATEGQEGQLKLSLLSLSPKMVNQMYLGTERYLYDYSVLHAFFFCAQNLVLNEAADSKIAKISDMDDSFFDSSSVLDSTPKTRLVICLIESFESWVLTPEVMPSLYALTLHQNVLYCPHVVSQTRRGTSADGQMIVETGLLPINGGAVCRLYQSNTFPSLSHLYGRENSAGLFPHPLKVWDQDKMSIAYGFGDSYTCSEDDAVLFATASDLMKQYESLLFITMSTHSPFKLNADKSNLSLPDDMPLFMGNYMKSFNYFDSCISSFIDYIDKDSLFKQSTIVFTGDHIIFQDEKRESFANYCLGRKECNYDVSNATCPLIIYSPLIKGNNRIEANCYQMDIYPTLVKLIGCSSYCWNGFGIDLLDYDKNTERTISEKEAFNLSDNMIRSDFFRDYEGLVHPNN